MLDTLTLADRLTAAGLEPRHAQAIAHAINDAQGDAVHRRDIDSLATRSDLSALEARLTWRFVGALVAVAGLQVAATAAVFRVLTQ